MPLLPVVPELVSDATLKEASVESGGNSYLRITGETETDLTPITTTLGSPSDSAWDGTDPEASVISILKGIYDKADTPTGIVAKIRYGRGGTSSNISSTSTFTRVTNTASVSVENNKALLTVAKVTDASGDYRWVAPLNSLVITLVENQTGSTQTLTVGDFQYQYLLTAGSPLYYKKIEMSGSGPLYLKLYDSSTSLISGMFDLNAGDTFSVIYIVPSGKYTFGPLD